MAGRFGRWRLLAAVLVAALGVSVAVPVAAQEAAAGPGGFGDVTSDAYYADAVEALAGDGVFAGTECAEGLCGGADIDRKTMAVWVVRTLDGEDPAAVTASRFDDVDASGFHAPFIERMAALNVTAGCGDGTGFCPDDTVDRAQMAVFLTRAFDLADGPDPGFGDVPATAWFAAEVAKLAASGITVGCGGSNFCPDRETNRAEMAVFLARATGKIQTPERASQAPAVLLSYTTPEAMHDSEAWPSPDWRHVAYFVTVTSLYEAPDGNEVGDLYVAASDGSNLTKVASDVLGESSCGDDVCGYPPAWWSPDSSRFWYVTIEDRDDQGEATSLSLRVAAADGTRTRSVQIIQDDQRIDRPYGGGVGGWSPDSQHIAYIIGWDGAGLFVVAADGTNPTRLTDGNLSWSDVAWSSDSGHIAYRHGDVLYSARADGTNPSKLAAAVDDYFDPAFPELEFAELSSILWWWSPDGSRIAYDNGDGALYSVLADGSGTVKLGDGAAYVGWSPDGSRIAYRADGQLYSVLADGSGTVKLGDGAGSGWLDGSGWDDAGHGAFIEGHGAFIGWSPDGSRIAYLSGDDGDEVHTALADGSGTTKIVQDVDLLGWDGTRFQWSPDGRYIAYAPEEEDGRSMFIARGDGSSPPRLVATDAGWNWRPPVWSPDGSHVAYHAPMNRYVSSLFMARADGSNVTKLSDHALDSFIWSSDSTRIAYLTFTQQGPEPDDYDPDDWSTWPYYRASVEVSGIGGESIAKFATAYTVQRSWPCDLLTLTWRSEGIEFAEEWGGQC